MFMYIYIYIHFGSHLIVFFMMRMPGVQHGAVLQSRAVLPGRTAGSFGTGTGIANSCFFCCGCPCGWKLPRTTRRLCFISDSLWSDFWDCLARHSEFTTSLTGFLNRPLQLNSLLSTITPKVPSPGMSWTNLKIPSHGSLLLETNGETHKLTA